MFEFLASSPIVEFFVNYGWLGFIAYIFLVYGWLFLLGIELKSRGLFEDWIFMLTYGVAWIIAWVIAGGIAWGIVGGIAGGIMWIIAWVIAGGIAWGIVGEIIAGIAWVVAWIIAGGIAWVVAWGIVGDIVMGISWGIAWILAGGIAWIMAKEIAWWVIEEMVKSKYGRALRYLENNDPNNCLKYLNQLLYLLKNYEDDEKPYFNENLANKVISLKNNLALIEKANNYYNSGNYKEALKLYKKIINKNPELREILGIKHKELIAIKKIPTEEIQKIDESLKNEELEELKHEEQPSVESHLTKAKELSSNALSLFNQNKLGDAIDKWMEAIEQYKKAKKIAKLNEDEEIMGPINKNIKILVNNALKAGIMLICDGLGCDVQNTLSKVNEFESFLNRHRNYLDVEEYDQYQKVLGELGIKTKLKIVELGVGEAISLKSKNDYLKAREILKNALKLLENVENEVKSKKINMFNKQINTLKTQIENELSHIKNILLEDESPIDIQLNQINSTPDKENKT